MKIYRYSKDLKQRLIHVLRFIWRGLTFDQCNLRFEWRYVNNPYCKQPFVFLALDEEKVAGFRAFVCQKARLNNKQTNIFSPADAIVHPDYRRMGIFSKLNKACLEEADIRGGVILNLSSNKYSTPGYLKQGWQKTTRVKKYGYRFNLWNIVMGLLRKAIKKPALQDEIIIYGKQRKLVISKNSQPKTLALFVEENRSKDKISNLRDAAYFQWRYAYKSDTYRFVYAYQQDKLVGYLILKKSSAVQYVLLEYYTASYKLMQWMIKQCMRKLQIGVLRTWVLSTYDHKLLRKCGFIIEPVNLMTRLGKERLPVLVRPTTPEPKEQDFFYEGKDIRDINNWQLFLADSH